MSKKLIWMIAFILIGIFLYKKLENDPLLIPNILGQSKPELVRTDCWFKHKFDRPTSCAYLHVLEDWEDPDSRIIRLPVVTFKSKNNDQRTDPVLYLQGGPGPAYIEKQDIAWFYENYITEAWLESYDVIVMDYRGIGYAKPKLECDNLFKQMMEIKSHDEFFDIYTKCHNKLKSTGLNLSKYHAVNIVNDLKFLRDQLDIPIWNLWGQSYGSLIAIMLAQEEQSNTRSVIVEGVAPPRNLVHPTGEEKLFVKIVDNLLHDCEADARCMNVYPNNSKRLSEAINILRDNPKHITVEVQNEDYEILLDDITFISMIFEALYQSQPVNFIPKLISDIHTNNLNDIKSLIEASIYESLPQWFSIAGLITFVCNDSGLQDANHIQSQNLPRWINSWATYPDVCKLWLEDSHIPELENKKSSFKNPILFLSGKNDPATPYQWARNALPDFENGQMYLFPKLSHGFSSSRCARDFKSDFINNPFEKVESDCLYPIYFDDQSKSTLTSE